MNRDQALGIKNLARMGKLTADAFKKHKTLQEETALALEDLCLSKNDLEAQRSVVTKLFDEQEKIPVEQFVRIDGEYYVIRFHPKRGIYGYKTKLKTVTTSDVKKGKKC